MSRDTVRNDYKGLLSDISHLQLFCRQLFLMKEDFVGRYAEVEKILNDAEGIQAEAQRQRQEMSKAEASHRKTIATLKNEIAALSVSKKDKKAEVDAELDAYQVKHKDMVDAGRKDYEANAARRLDMIQEQYGKSEIALKIAQSEFDKKVAALEVKIASIDEAAEQFRKTVK